MGFLGFGEKGGGLSSAFKDMKDGGGRGGSGNSYSTLDNADYQRIGGGAAVAGERPQGYTSIDSGGNRQRRGGLLSFGYGYEDPTTKQWVPFGVDAINGGGAGMAGNRFKGPFAITGLLNALGVRPQGYAERQAAMAQAGSQSGAPTAAAITPQGVGATQAAPQDFYNQTGNPAMAQTPWNATQAGPQDFYNIPYNNPAMAGGTAPAAQNYLQDPAYMSFLSRLPEGTLKNSPEFLRKLYEMGQNHTPTFMPPPSGVMR
jgi:hypothetical protein